MPAPLDHMILNVNDRAKSIEFYTRVLGFAYEGEREGTPSSIIRVTPSFMLQLSPFGTRGGEHLAFAVSRVEFDETLRKIRELSIGYGDSFDAVGNMHAPGDSEGAKGHGEPFTSSIRIGTSSKSDTTDR